MQVRVLCLSVAVCGLTSPLTAQRESTLQSSNGTHMGRPSRACAHNPSNWESSSPYRDAMPVDGRRIDSKDGDVDPIACTDELEDFSKFIEGGDVIAT